MNCYRKLPGSCGRPLCLSALQIGRVVGVSTLYRYNTVAVLLHREGIPCRTIPQMIILLVVILLMAVLPVAFP